MNRPAVVTTDHEWAAAICDRLDALLAKGTIEVSTVSNNVEIREPQAVTPAGPTRPAPRKPAQRKR